MIPRDYELLQLKQIMKVLCINKNKLCKQCQCAPTFKESDRCYNCVMYESSLLIQAFVNSLNMLYTFNRNMKAKGKTFAKIIYSSLCWCVNVASFTSYTEKYGDPIQWVPEIHLYVKGVDNDLQKYQKPRLFYHQQNGVQEPIHENKCYYENNNESDYLLSHINWIYSV